LFGGVFWDVQDVLLEDVDRIEVVSGPGGTVWGANAVNGVINIVTRSADETQGWYASAGGGSMLHDFGMVRYGGRLNNRTSFRVYGQEHNRRSSQLGDGTLVDDAWRIGQGGFRADYRPSSANAVTVQGDFYIGREGTPASSRMAGQNLLARWKQTRSKRSDITVQFYADHTRRHLPLAIFRDDIMTYDLDVQHHIQFGARHNVVWGGNARWMIDRVLNTAGLSFYPANRTLQLVSGVVQDEIALRPDRLKLTLGTKLERNEYSGFELQPNARLAWLVSRRHTLWTAVSRAVRAPARFDVDIALPVLIGDPDFAAEKVVAYEGGYRVLATDKVSMSFALFTNRYSDLRSVNFNLSPPPIGRFTNDQQGASWGGEFSGNAQITDWWRLRGGYTYFVKRLHATSAAVVPGSDTFEGNDPRNQALVHSIMDLEYGMQLDVVTRYVDTLPTPSVRRYVTSDARLAWQRDVLELALIGQNLWRRRQAEFGPLMIPRSVYGRLTVHY
jgi:iron complex outermembrane receptor protein